MRITGPNAASVPAASTTRRRAATGGTFSVAEEETASQAAPAAQLRTVGGIDALLALQGEDEPTGRRKRAVRKGRAALDALEELKLALLAGSLNTTTVNRLKAAAAELQIVSGTLSLDTVLAEIEVRIEVEIAKLSPRPPR